MKVIGCIPSRYASSRLPGKPLVDIAGKPMILHVIERAKQAKKLSDVVVLTDDERIYDAVTSAGHHAAMTSTDCASGTDRIAEYMEQDPSADVFVNIQGDEILLDPEHVDHLVEHFTSKPHAQMGTLAQWITDPTLLNNPSTVKVVIDTEENAMYFSRNCIPVRQDGSLPEKALGHIGVYIYTWDTLKHLKVLQQTALETTEHLEQLRALENGIQIDVTIVDHYESLAVDTPKDLERAREMFGR